MDTPKLVNDRMDTHLKGRTGTQFIMKMCGKKIRDQ